MIENQLFWSLFDQFQDYNKSFKSCLKSESHLRVIIFMQGSSWYEWHKQQYWRCRIVLKKHPYGSQQCQLSVQPWIVAWLSCLIMPNLVLTWTRLGPCFLMGTWRHHSESSMLVIFLIMQLIWGDTRANESLSRELHNWFHLPSLGTCEGNNQPARIWSYSDYRK